ncbi:MAG: YbjQ family protein [Candidatus Gastranaerophilales bacterium]|nr:YbjQ family protein [Candidatus Gastranaerophilales bacterium]
MSDLLIFILLLIGTYITGCIIEKKHYKKIQQREIALIKKPFINFGAKKWRTKRKIKKVELVTGEVVISGDYFKNFVVGLKNLVGGRLTPYESVLDRARREAILRMREKARGANIIVNTRIESILMNNIYSKNTVARCAIIAYGTAVTYE